MMNRVRTTASRSDEGASAVEYGLLIAAIAALIVGVVFVLGGLVKNSFSKTCSAIGSGTSQSTSSC